MSKLSAPFMDHLSTLDVIVTGTRKQTEIVGQLVCNDQQNNGFGFLHVCLASLNGVSRCSSRQHPRNLETVYLLIENWLTFPKLFVPVYSAK